MKIKLLILTFYSGTSFILRCQVNEGIKWPVMLANNCTPISKSLNMYNSSLFPLKKDLTFKYHPAKLPFFCGMEEKCRNKFNLFIKLRAGNDESYRKMISSPNNRLPGK